MFKLLCSTFGVKEFEDNSIFRFKDVLAIVLELSNLYTLYYGEHANVYSLYSVDYEKGIYCTTTKKEIFERISPRLGEDFEMLAELLHGQAIQYRLKEGRESPDYIGVYQAKIGGSYIVGGINYEHDLVSANKYVEQLIGHYICMFILSINVRCKQHFWGKVISGESNGVVSIIERYLRVVRRMFPNAILDKFFNESYEYGSPGRWG